MKALDPDHQDLSHYDLPGIDAELTSLTSGTLRALKSSNPAVHMDRDTYRPARSPPRAPPPDSYTPRRRSRSPPGGYRNRDTETYRPRAYSPRRMDYTRERSPARRTREVSPPRRPYSPAPSSRGAYRQRSRSPLRRLGEDYDRADLQRPGSLRGRSPSGADYASGGNSVRGSIPSSRRSSPPAHTSRVASQSRRDVDDRRPPLEPVSPRARSRRDYSPPRRDELDYRRRESPPRERHYPPNGGHPSSRPPPPEHIYHNGGSEYSRPPPPSGPPSGPRTYGPPGMSPPAGPAAAPMSMSAHNRPGSASILSAPSQPRGGAGRGYGYERPPPRDPYAPRDYGYGPPPRRSSGAYGPPPPHGYHRGPPAQGGYHQEPYGPPHYGGPPRGPPRGDSYGPPAPYPHAPPFRGSSNSTSTTYPRTLRFNSQGQPVPSTPRDRDPSRHPALADMPQEIPGGQRMPDPYDNTKITKLEEEAERLRRMIDEKQAKKRQGLRDWDKLAREAAREGLRSELAESSLASLNGEPSGGAAF